MKTKNKKKEKRTEVWVRIGEEYFDVATPWVAERNVIAVHDGVIDKTRGVDWVAKEATAVHNAIVKALVEKIDSLRSVTASMLNTGDGVPITVGMRIWMKDRNSGEITSRYVDTVGGGTVTYCVERRAGFRYEEVYAVDCYSTEEAARKVICGLL